MIDFCRFLKITAKGDYYDMTGFGDVWGIYGH